MKLYSTPGAPSLFVFFVMVFCGATPGWAQIEPSAAEVQAQRDAATTRFVAGDVEGALEALNAIGEPRISDIRVEGLVRGNPVSLADYLDLREGDVLTRGRLARANRKLIDFPTASIGTVRYDLLEDSVIVRPIIFERSRSLKSATTWASIAARTVFTRELRLTFSDLTGHSDVWSPSVRWAAGRPRVRLQVAAPAPGVLPGVARVDLSWQKENYPGDVEVERVRAGAFLGDWVTSWLRVEAGPAFNRIATTNYLELNANVNGRALDDHVAAIVSGSVFRTQTSSAFSTGDVILQARSTTQDDRPRLSARVGMSVAESGAPLVLWPAAASAAEPVGLLRAHRFYNSGVLTTEAFGRQLAYATVEYVHPLPTRFGPAFMGLAAFTDAAQARSRIQPTDSPVLVDVGFGLRVNTSRAGNQIRLDLAQSLQDGRRRFSVGYVAPWGER
ncbi:MAG: hypothetical protein ABL986_04530 [Vicinamibacterales bacterium]